MNWQILKGDFFECVESIPSQSIDFVLTDPPYGQTRSPWDKKLDIAQTWTILERVVKKNAAICLFADELYSAELMVSNRKGYKHKWIWWKNRGSNFLNAGKTGPLDVTEDVLVFSFGAPMFNPQKTQGHTPMNFARRKANSSTVFGGHGEHTNQAGDTTRNPTNVLLFNSVNNDSKERIHPNQKPVDLLQYLIRTYCPAGGSVLDFTAGGCSTGEACIYENRDVILIEGNPKYYEAGEARLKRVIRERESSLFAVI